MEGKGTRATMLQHSWSGRKGPSTVQHLSAPSDEYQQNHRGLVVNTWRTWMFLSATTALFMCERMRKREFFSDPARGRYYKHSSTTIKLLQLLRYSGNTHAISLNPAAGIHNIILIAFWEAVLLWHCLMLDTSRIGLWGTVSSRCSNSG